MHFKYCSESVFCMRERLKLSEKDKRGVRLIRRQCTRCEGRKFFMTSSACRLSGRKTSAWRCGCVRTLVPFCQGLPLLPRFSCCELLIFRQLYIYSSPIWFFPKKCQIQIMRRLVFFVGNSGQVVFLWDWRKCWFCFSIWSAPSLCSDDTKLHVHAGASM